MHKFICFKAPLPLSGLETNWFTHSSCISVNLNAVIIICVFMSYNWTIVFLYALYVILHVLNVSNKAFPKKAVSAPPSTCENKVFCDNHKSRAQTRFLEDRYNGFKELLLLVVVYIFCYLLVNIIEVNDFFISPYLTSLDFKNCLLPIELIGFFTS